MRYRSEWLAFAGAALIKQQDVIMGHIKEAIFIKPAASARSAMQINHRFASRIAIPRVVQLMTIASIKEAGFVWCLFRVQMVWFLAHGYSLSHLAVGAKYRTLYFP